MSILDRIPVELSTAEEDSLVKVLDIINRNRRIKQMYQDLRECGNTQNECFFLMADFWCLSERQIKRIVYAK